MSLDATVGGTDSNSYLTVAEADAYWADRPHSEVWTETAESKEALLISATMLIDAMLSPFRRLVPASGSCQAYYVTRPTWTGAPTDVDQALAWPRTGMFNRNGGVIPSNIIPQSLKFAVAELAGQLSSSDHMLDYDVAVSGLKSLRAGPVSLTFADNIQALRALPASVFLLLVQSWFTSETTEFVTSLIFTVDR